MPTRLFDSSKSPVAIGREIARGGEGTVFEVEGATELAVKIYHEAIDRNKTAKLLAMVRTATPQLVRVAAWPRDTIHRVPGGPVVGMLMPRVSGYREIHELYSPAQRKLAFPKATWEFLLHVAMNCATAFETIHECGHVVGDINQSGVLVANNATVKLIDCDSFQIVHNGHTFPCIVGVPQYTPPELQGRAFRGVTRTIEHDGFGLAMLIFHLLFMGRHPFAGLYHGNGHMPIERAISEGRFAFGLYSKSREMSPPPHSLPISALPDQIPTMFEVAFGRPSARTSRPTATDWRLALAAVKSNLKKCPKEEGHCFPRQLSSCPWCEIVRGNGPNFFISTRVTDSGTEFSLPKFDHGAIWMRIDAVPRPTPERPRPIPSQWPLSPTPLPSELADLQFSARLANFAAMVAAVVGFAGAAFGVAILLMALVIAVGFRMWAMLLNANPAYEDERQRRVKEANRNWQALALELAEWDQYAGRAVEQFDLLKCHLRRCADECSRIPARFENELKGLVSTRCQDQFEAFLDRRFVRNYKIDGIGAGRLSTLASFGIETAYDMRESRLKRVPGVGPKMIRALLDWRAAMEREFVFDKSKATSPIVVKGLMDKYRALQDALRNELTAGERQLAGVGNAVALELEARTDRIMRLYRCVERAEIDATIVGGVTQATKR